MADKNLGMRIELSVDATKVKEGLDETQKQLKEQQNELSKTNKLMRFETNPITAYNNKIKEINKTLPLLNTNIQKQSNFVKQLNKDYEAETDPKRRKQLSKEIENQTKLLNNLKDQYESLNKELEFTTKKVDDFGEANKKAMEKASEEKLGKISSGLNKISTAVVAGITAIYAAGSKAADEITELNEKATEAGISVENYQRLAYAMEQVGLSSDTAGQVMVKTNSIIAKVASGSGQDAVKVLNKLGISWEQFEKLDTEEAFNLLVDSLGQVTDKSELLADLTKLFGDNLATKMLPVIEAGSSALAEYGENATIIGEEQVDAAKKTENLKEQLSATALTLGATLLPFVNKILEKVTELANKATPYIQSFIEKLDSMSPVAQKIIAIVTGITAAAGPLFTIGTKIFKLVKDFPKLLSILAAHPIIAAIAAVVALLVIMYEKNEKFRNSVNKLMTAILEPLGKMLESLMEILQPLVDIIMESLMNRLNLLAEILSPILDLLTTILKPILDALATVIQFISELLQPLFDFLKKIFDQVGELTSSLFGSGSLGEAFQKLGDFLKSVFGPIVEWISKLWENMIGWISKAVDAVGGFFESVGSWVSDRANDVGGWFESLGNWFTGNGWNTNAQLSSAGTASTGYIGDTNTGSGNNTNNNYGNNTYNVTVNTTSDHMSLDELNDNLGYSY